MRTPAISSGSTSESCRLATSASTSPMLTLRLPPPAAEQSPSNEEASHATRGWRKCSHTLGCAALHGPTLDAGGAASAAAIATTDGRI
eukprot:scaffold201992_cov35-Tisochrysis_lutea.AAC.1